MPSRWMQLAKMAIERRAEEKLETELAESKPALVIIIAGNFKQYREWCQEHGYQQPGRGDRQFVAHYASEPDRLRGFDRDTPVYFVGDWYNSRWANDFVELRQRLFK